MFIVFIVLLVVFAFLVTAVELYAIIRLLKASSEENNVSAKKALSYTRFWYYLSIILLLMVIVPHLIPFDPKKLVGVAIGVSIRVYMLRTVKKYIDALEKRLLETGGYNQVFIPNSVKKKV